jgi:serralysin
MASVPENMTGVMTVTAADIQTVTYSIVDGADQAKFRITTNGVLSFLMPPNFETPTDSNSDNIYVVTVEASDGEGGMATQTISVSVTPVNESSPVFTSVDAVTVPENTTSILTVTASDADFPPQTITFSIVAGADQSKFSVTPGGALSFNTAPDFESPTDSNGDNVYVVVVQASDGGFTSVQAILVTVTLNNHHVPVITSANTANVPENSTAVLTVTATDADLPPQVVTYSLVGGADQARFAITSGGLLTFNSPPNFEAPADSNGDNVYVVTVEANDGNGGTAMQAIQVTVTPVNEFGPVFTSSDSASVAENTTAVTTMTAADADLPAQAITFSIVGGADQSKFAITSGGSLTFNSPPNFEAPNDANGDNIYVVVVQASDGSLTNVQAILVTVTSVNDNNPVSPRPTRLASQRTRRLLRRSLPPMPICRRKT